MSTNSANNATDATVTVSANSAAESAAVSAIFTDQWKPSNQMVEDLAQFRLKDVVDLPSHTFNASRSRLRGHMSKWSEAFKKNYLSATELDGKSTISLLDDAESKTQRADAAWTALQCTVTCMALEMSGQRTGNVAPHGEALLKHWSSCQAASTPDKWSELVDTYFNKTSLAAMEGCEILPSTAEGETSPETTASTAEEEDNENEDEYVIVPSNVENK